jgi:hypothetical protein
MSACPGYRLRPYRRLFRQRRRQRKPGGIDAKVDDAAFVGVAAQEG